MCGIAGIFSLDGMQVERQVLKRMADSIAHRGPDGEGIWIDDTESIGFSHRRLAIIDLSERASQPMHYFNNRYTIVFNGEIYNYIELRKSLITAGYSFKTDSDTEVLLALYHVKKEKCLDELDGMFAFALYDSEEKMLFCARDRFGEKPFYFYFEKEKQFVFASEMKAIWKAGIIKKTDEQMLFNYLSLGFIHHPNQPDRTFFEGIKKLKAGHFLKLKANGVLEISKYWSINPKIVDKKIMLEDASEKLKQLLSESVNKRLRSDVPVGSSLSGGIDSSIIVCLIDQFKKSDSFSQNTFSARYKNFQRDEGKFIQMVVDQTSVTPHYIYPDEDLFIKNIDKLLYHQEEPFGTASIFAQYCVMQLAKENGTIVLLDGQGADEILAGYEYFYYYYFLELARKNIFRLQKEFQAYKQQVTDFKKQLGKLFFAYAMFPGLMKSIQSFRNKQKIETQSYFAQDFYEHHISLLHKNEFADTSNLNTVLYQSTFTGQLENLLRFADRNSMAHSREVRLPFLNHQLVEFIFSLPSNFKINNGWRKYILRNAFKDVLPTEIAWRKDKIGFEAPQNQWINNNQIKNRMISGYEKMVDAKILNQKILQPEFLSNLSKRENMNNAWNYWLTSEMLV